MGQRNREETAELIRLARNKLRTETRVITYNPTYDDQYGMTTVTYRQVMQLLERALASAEGREYPKPLGWTDK